MNGQGHNSAAYGQEILDEFDFRAFFDFVCSSHASMAEKMLTLIHARRAGPHGEPGTISRAEAMKLASCSSATFQRAIPIVRIFFEIEQKRGKPTMYKPDRAITTDQIEAAITTIRAGGMYQKDTSKMIDTSKSTTQSDISKSSIDQNDTSNRSIPTDQGDTYQQKEIPPTPPKEKTTNLNNNHPSLETAGVGDVQVLNGATSHIVKTLGEWINPIMPDHKTARGWLESSVSMYGGVVVRDSFAELEAKVMQGDIVARPIPLLTKICQRRKGEKPKSQRPDPMAKIYSGVR